MKAFTKASKMNQAALQTLNLALAVLIAMPAVADVSTRKPIDPKSSFAKIAGKISQVGSTNGEFGNGFVVGKEGCHVLTNFHVAFGKTKDSSNGEVELVDNVDVGHTVNFALELDARTGKFKKNIKAKVVEFGNYEAGTSRGFLGDIALLRLETCLGSEYGQLEIDRPAADKRVPTGKLMTISTSLDESGKNQMLMEEGCRADSATSVTGMMISSCVGVPGMSGSMVLEEGVDNKWRLVGLTTKLSKYADGRPATKAIYAKVINKFLDGALGESEVGIQALAQERKPQSDEKTAMVRTATVVR